MKGVFAWAWIKPLKAERNTEKNIVVQRHLIALAEIMALAIIVKEIGFTNLIKKFKLNPIYIIIFSGILGIILYKLFK